MRGNTRKKKGRIGQHKYTTNTNKTLLVNNINEAQCPHLNSRLSRVHGLVAAARGESDVDERGDQVRGLTAVSGSSVIKGAHVGGSARGRALNVHRSPAVEASGRVHAVLPVDGPLHEDEDDHVPVGRDVPWEKKRTVIWGGGGVDTGISDEHRIARLRLQPG